MGLGVVGRVPINTVGFAGPCQFQLLLAFPFPVGSHRCQPPTLPLLESLLLIYLRWGKPRTPKSVTHPSPGLGSVDTLSLPRAPDF